jgi:predicted DNA-binding transcriptional regulator AlpA
MSDEQLVQTANAALLEDYLGKEELAKELDISERTLDRLETRRVGPPRTVIGRTILYRKEAVRDWLKSRERQRNQPQPRRKVRP